MQESIIVSVCERSNFCIRADTENMFSMNSMLSIVLNRSMSIVSPQKNVTRPRSMLNALCDSRANISWREPGTENTKVTHTLVHVHVENSRCVTNRHGGCLYCVHLQKKNHDCQIVSDWAIDHE